MDVIVWFLLIVYGIIGGVPTLFLLLGMPGVFIWKCYRKLHDNIPLTK